MRRRKGETMNNIKLKTNLENYQDEWKNFEEKEFSLNFLSRTLQSQSVLIYH